MDLPQKKKPNSCDEDCECKDCEMKFANDDEGIQVSVSPRRFGLPPTQEKKATMEIKNKNPYPIYFKASTSNMEAFKTQPNCGRIAPNSKVSIDVKFYDSAMPLRRHEEVIVFTSVKPFEEYSMYRERVCPYCMEPFDFSKHHSQKRHAHTDDCWTSSEHRSYKKNDKLQKCTTKYYTESPYDEYFDKKYKVSTKQKLKTESDKTEPKWVTPPETKAAKKVQDEDERKTKQKTTDYVQKHFSPSEPRIINSDEKMQKTKEHSRRTAKHMKGSHELKEVCIHAMVHQPYSGSCECGSCVKLEIEKKDGRKFERDSTSEEQKDARKSKSDEHPSERKLRGTEKDIYTGGDKKYEKDARKGKAREAHILARILRAEYSKETSSETEISELSSKDVKLLPRRTKIISEEDYKKKKEKLKKKFQQCYEDESESTATVDSKGQKKEVDEKITRLGRSSTLKVIDEKCSTLLKLTWTNFFLLLFIIVLIVGGFFCCCGSDKIDKPYSLPCFFDILHNFE